MLCLSENFAEEQFKNKHNTAAAMFRSCHLKYESKKNSANSNFSTKMLTQILANQVFVSKNGKIFW